jgi:hypothetical protein
MEGAERGRFGPLLVTLLLNLLVSPFVENLPAGRFLFNLFTTIVLFSALYSISENKRWFFYGFVLSIPAIAGIWTGFFSTGASRLASAPVLTTFFLAYIAYRLLSHVLKSNQVTSETIFAALCAYLLVGMIWSYFHFGLEFLQPGSYQGLSASVNYSGGRGTSFLYFSFVTLTTLGYGDVTPVSSAARSFSYVEALMGQLYLAVLIARLVGMHIAHQMKE